jgi:hypothetical protein
MHRPNKPRLHGHILTLALAALLTPACEELPPDASAGAADVQSEAGTLADSPTTVPIPYPYPAEASCDPNAPEAWIEAQRKVYEERVRAQRHGPPAPVDEQCRLIIDRSCDSVCDCTFAHGNPGRFQSVSRHQPWRAGTNDPYAHGTTNGGLPPGQCMAEFTFFTAGANPISDDDTLACIEGKCRTFYQGELMELSEFWSPGPAPVTVPLPGSTTLACDPTDPASYTQELYQRLLFARMAFTPADFGTCDTDCQPVIERQCQTACDCKLILADCKVRAASRQQAANVWSCGGWGKSTTGEPQCEGARLCNHKFPAGTCNPTLACVEGQCVATPAPDSTPCTAPSL